MPGPPEMSRHGKDAPAAAEPPLPALIPIVNGTWGWKRLLCLFGALVLMVLGVAAVPLPVASGFLFWIPGLLMLGVAVPPVARFVNRHEQRLPLRWRRRLRPRLWRTARRRLRESLS